MTTQEPSSPQASFTEQGVPTHIELVLPVLRAIRQLGGSARTAEITDQILSTFPDADALLEYHYPGKPQKKVFTGRINWARSTAKAIGATESPALGVSLLTEPGERLANLADAQAQEQIHELYRHHQKQRRIEKSKESNAASSLPDLDNNVQSISDDPDQDIVDDAAADDTSQDADWKTTLLHRLHQLSPEGFEKFVIYLLRRYGLQLQHVGGSGDEGVDAIGTAPLSPILSSRVAVQIKRYAPDGQPIGRETVALFQRDAQTKGAERAVLVTLSRFTEPARKAATMAIPTVDLISGDRLADLIRQDGGSGVQIQPTVDVQWFNKFD